MVGTPFSDTRRVAEQIRIICNLSYNLSDAQRHAVCNTEPVRAENIGIMQAAHGASTPDERGEQLLLSQPFFVLSKKDEGGCNGLYCQEIKHSLWTPAGKVLSTCQMTIPHKIACN